MKKHIQFLVAFILFTSLYYSCNYKEEDNIFLGKSRYITSFSDTLFLKGEKVTIENMGAINIDIIDSFLVFSSGSLDTFYNVYSKYTYQHYGHFIPQGRGDNELPTISYPIFWSNEKGHSLIYLDNRATGTVKAWDITQSCAKRTTVFSPTPIDISPVPGFQYLYPLQGSVYFLHGRDYNTMNDYYALYDESKKQYSILDTVYLYPSGSVDDVFLLNTFKSFNPSQQKYATAMQFFNQINLYSLKNPHKHYSLIVGKHPTHLEEVKTTAMPEKFEYYEDLTSTSSFLFAVYANRSRKDWALLENVPTEIQVFDWDGNACYLIQTQEKLASIAIDEERKLLYGMTLAETVYKYDIATIL